MATKAKAKSAVKKTTSKDELRAAFSEQLGTLHDENVRLRHENAELKGKCENIAFACSVLQRELDNLKAAVEKKSSRHWVLRKLGL